MGERRIRVILANLLLVDERKSKKTLRVAAYCRVSTDDEEQQSSFETQVKYYTEKINSHEGWQLVRIFADEGISGVRTKKRVQFNEMIAQCQKRKLTSFLRNPFPGLRGILWTALTRCDCSNGWESP